MEMTMTVIGSGSAGNCYVLQNEEEALVIEAGLPFDKEVKKSLGWNTSKVKALICSHQHGDHSAYAKQYEQAGIRVLALPEVLQLRGIGRLGIAMAPGRGVKVGNFKILPFPLIHYNTDGSRCPNLGFLITHQDAGRICFFTDCESFTREVQTDDGIRYQPYDFTDVNHWMMEANYDDFILNRSHHLDDRLKERIRRSHMSLRNCLKIAKRLDLHATREILLIHLSDGNSDDRKFIREMRKATNKRVFAAHAGLQIQYNITPTF